MKWALVSHQDANETFQQAFDFAREIFDVEPVFEPSLQAGVVECEDDVQMNWIYDGSTFAPPPGTHLFAAPDPDRKIELPPVTNVQTFIARMNQTELDKFVDLLVSSKVMTQKRADSILGES